MYKYDRNNNIKQANSLLRYLYTLKEGKYSFKNGFIYSEENSLMSEDYFFDGNGNIEIDKYGNVRFNINSPKICMSKTYLGDVSIDDKCEELKDIKVNISRNNSVISFSSSTKGLYYKISKNDDFKGPWNKNDSNGNIVLKYYNQGDNYIWFKDYNGNISKVVKFNVECLNTKEAKYDKSIFYCSGSTVVIDNEEWVVLEDNSSFIKLLKKEPILDKLSVCLEKNPGFCHKKGEDIEYYRWGNSFANYYLNDMYLKTLSEEMKNSLMDMEICDDFDSLACSNNICGGYTRKEIEDNEWSCSIYTKSKVKLISYNEFNYAYVNSQNKSSLKGNYLAINSFTHNFASSIQNNYDFYILEDIHKNLDVRPVIQLSK